MPKRLTPRKYVVSGDCSPQCSISKDALGEERFAVVHGMYEAALNDFEMEKRLRAVDVNLSHGAIGRHRKNHLVEADSVEMDEGLAELTDIEAIELALSRGQKNIKNWKLTPSEYIKFMELKYRLTSGSTNDAMFAALAAGAAEEDEQSGPEGFDEPLEDPE